MSLLVFGVIWNAFIAFFTYLMMFSGDGATVNGQYMTTEEVRAQPMLWIFLGIFWFIGFFLMYKGGKKVIADILTKTKGFETYGAITDIYFSGTRVNHRPEYIAEILGIDENNNIIQLKDSIGFGRCQYDIGEILKIKYYKKDFNILKRLTPEEVPMDKMELLMNYGQKFANINQNKNHNSINNGRTMFNNNMNPNYGANFDVRNSYQNGQGAKNLEDFNNLHNNQDDYYDNIEKHENQNYQNAYYGSSGSSENQGPIYVNGQEYKQQRF